MAGLAMPKNRWVAIGAIGAVAAAAVGVAALGKGGGGGGGGSSAGASEGATLAGVQAGAAAAASTAQLGAVGFQTGAMLGQSALELAGRVTDVLGNVATSANASLSRVAAQQTTALVNVMRQPVATAPVSSGPGLGGGITNVFQLAALRTLGRELSTTPSAAFGGVSELQAHEQARAGESYSQLVADYSASKEGQTFAATSGAAA